MLDVGRMLLHGLLLSVVASLGLLVCLLVNPRMLIQDYPRDIQAMVPPKTAHEKRLSLLFGIPLLVVMLGIPFLSTRALGQQLGGSASFATLFANAFGVAQTFNVVDWLVLDWLVCCAITPRFVVIPGTEGAAGYKNYWFHFRGFLIGTVLSAIGGLVIAGIVVSS